MMSFQCFGECSLITKANDERPTICFGSATFSSSIIHRKMSRLRTLVALLIESFDCFNERSSTMANDAKQSATVFLYAIMMTVNIIDAAHLGIVRSESCRSTVFDNRMLSMINGAKQPAFVRLYALIFYATAIHGSHVGIEFKW